MNFTANADYIRIAIILVIFGMMIFLTYLAFVSSQKIVQKLGKNVISVIGKLMGLIIAIMGTGMVLDGIKLANF